VVDGLAAAHQHGEFTIGGAAHGRLPGVPGDGTALRDAAEFLLDAPARLGDEPLTEFAALRLSDAIEGVHAERHHGGGAVPGGLGEHAVGFLAEVAAVGQAGGRVEVRQPAHGLLGGVQPRQVLQRDDHHASVGARRAFDEFGLLVQPGRRSVLGSHPMVEAEAAVAHRAGDERGPHDFPLGGVEQRHELLVPLEPRGVEAQQLANHRREVQGLSVGRQLPVAHPRDALGEQQLRLAGSQLLAQLAVRSRNRTRSTSSRGLRPFWAKSLAPAA